VTDFPVFRPKFWVPGPGGVAPKVTDFRPVFGFLGVDFLGIKVKKEVHFLCFYDHFFYV